MLLAGLLKEGEAPANEPENAGGKARRDEAAPMWRVSLLEATYRVTRGRESLDPAAREKGRQEALDVLRQLEQGEAGEDAAAWRELALKYEQLDQPADADRALARSQELDPTSAAYYALASSIWAARGDHEKAHAAIEAGVKKVPADEQELLVRAHAQLNREDNKEEQAARRVGGFVAKEPKRRRSGAAIGGNGAAAPNWTPPTVAMNSIPLKSGKAVFASKKARTASTGDSSAPADC